MKHILILTFIILILALSNSSTQVLKIHKNTGSDTTFYIDEIDSITFGEQNIAGDSVVFSDNFESTPLYAFPYNTGWILMSLSPDPKTLSNSVAIVDDKYYSSGPKALAVSTGDTCKVLINRRLDRLPKIAYFEVKVFVVNYSNDSGKAAMANFGFWNISESMAGENYAGFVIKDDGNLYCKIGATESVMAHLDLHRWYDLILRYDVANASLSAWVNYILIVPSFTTLYMPTFGYKDFSIISNNSNVYFDNLKIWSGN